MKRIILAALACRAPPPLLSRQPSRRATCRRSDPRIAALRDAALNDDYAWDITEGLTTEVGQRLAGTAAEARAREWAVAKLKSLGFSNVRVEPFDDADLDARAGERGDPRALPAEAGRLPRLATALRPARQESPAKSSASTRLPSSRPRPTPRCAARSSSSPMPCRGRRTARAMASSAGRAARARPSPAARARLAIVIRSIGTDYHRNPHAGVQTFRRRR